MIQYMIEKNLKNSFHRMKESGERSIINKKCTCHSEIREGYSFIKGVKMDILKTCIEYGQKEDNIRSMIQTGQRVNPMVAEDGLMDFEIVYGVNDLEAVKDYRAIDLLFQEILLLEKKDDFRFFNKNMGDNVTYHIVLDDITRLKLTYLKANTIQSYIDSDSLAKILMDKDELLRGNTHYTDVKYRIQKPAEEEFVSCCNDFYLTALNIAKGLYRDEVVYAIQIWQILRKKVDQMTSYYIGTEYDFKVSVGMHYEHIKTYLKPDHYDAYLETYTLPEREKIWSSLFKTASLFRKEGLYVAEKMGFEYPKRADRDIMKKIREIWNMYAQ